MDREEEIRKFAEEASESAIEFINSMRPHILLLGPSVKQTSEGSKLRKELSKRCWDLGTCGSWFFCP